MPEPRYRIESKKQYEIMSLMVPDYEFKLDAEADLAFLEKKYDDSAFNLGLKIVPVEVTE